MTDELRSMRLLAICWLTVELTRLRQAECRHLMIENFAPELFGKLVERLDEALNRK